MLKLYAFARVNKGARGNTRDLRVLWTLEEIGLPYEIVGMDHPNHDLDSPAYRALNPFGQIPVIDGDASWSPSPARYCSTLRARAAS